MWISQAGLFIYDPRSARTKTDGFYPFRVSCSKSWTERTRSVGRIVRSYSIATVSLLGIFAKLGRGRVRLQACIPPWFTTFVEPQCATGARWNRGSRSDEAIGPQDPEHFRPRQYRKRVGSSCSS